jgi:hypothetical protein
MFVKYSTIIMVPIDLGGNICRKRKRERERERERKLYREFPCDISKYICIIIRIGSSPLFFFLFTLVCHEVPLEMWKLHYS